MIRRTTGALLAGVVVLGAVVGAIAGPANAQTPPVTQYETRIVGGSQSAVGQWPWQAAILEHGYSNSYDAMFCGATVIAPNWVLTAAHCMINQTTGAPTKPSEIDVLTGTNVLGDGSGRRSTVSAVHIDPAYNGPTNENDVALVRLTTPTTAPPIAVVTAAQAALWAPGTNATIVGWGTTAMNATTHPSYLRNGLVPIQSDTTCRNDYPAGTDPFTGRAYESFIASSMVCAGPQGGGTDTCQGDSGGPLAVPGPGGQGWVQVGITSWGNGCALAGYPGIYSRLGAPALADYVATARRYAPFNDAYGFIVWQFVDFANRFPTASETWYWTNRLATDPPSTLVAALAQAPAWQQHGGALARLYRATFLRDPDTGGMSYWLKRLWEGTALGSVASAFTSSSEFSQRYGALADGPFVDRVYQNVLGRAPDDGGRTYWINRLGSGLGRGDMMVGFSESTEYRTATSARTLVGTTFFAMLRRMPSSAELTARLAEPLDQMIEELRATYAYAVRF